MISSAKSRAHIMIFEGEVIFIPIVAPLEASCGADNFIYCGVMPPSKDKLIKVNLCHVHLDPIGRKFSAFCFLNISKQFIAFFHPKNESQGKL